MTNYLRESWGQSCFITCLSVHSLLQNPYTNTSSHWQFSISPNSKIFQKIHLPLRFSRPWTLHQYCHLTSYPAQVFALHFRFSKYTSTQETNTTQLFEPWQLQLNKMLKISGHQIGSVKLAINRAWSIRRQVKKELYSKHKTNKIFTGTFFFHKLSVSAVHCGAHL